MKSLHRMIRVPPQVPGSEQDTQKTKKSRSSEAGGHKLSSFTTSISFASTAKQEGTLRASPWQQMTEEDKPVSFWSLLNAQEMQRLCCLAGPS